MTFNESNIIRSHGRFDGVRHGGGTSTLAGISETRMGNFYDANLDGAEFPYGAFPTANGEEGCVAGGADSEGRYSWEGSDSGRDRLRLHQMEFNTDERPGAAAYAHNMMHVGMDFTRNPEEYCGEVIQAGRELLKSVDEDSLYGYGRDAYDRLEMAVDERSYRGPESSKRALEAANDLLGETGGF